MNTFIAEAVSLGWRDVAGILGAMVLLGLVTGWLLRKL